MLFKPELRYPLEEIPWRHVQNIFPNAENPLTSYSKYFSTIIWIWKAVFLGKQLWLWRTAKHRESGYRRRTAIALSPFTHRAHTFRRVKMQDKGEEGDEGSIRSRGISSISPSTSVTYGGGYSVRQIQYRQSDGGYLQYDGRYLIYWRMSPVW